MNVGWEKIKLMDILDFKNGLNKEKKFFGKGSPIINYVDVYKGGGLYKKNILGKVDVNKNELARFNVRQGDVFFTRTSETLEEIGFSAVALDNFKDTVFSGFVLRARPKNNKLLPSFSKYCFRTQQIRKEIKEKSSCTTRALTSGGLLNHVNLSLPPLPEQEKIVEILEGFDNYLEKFTKAIELKKRIKKGIMQKLLTGKVRFSGFGKTWGIVKLGEISHMISGGTPSTKIPDYWNGNIPWVSSSDLVTNNIRFINIHRYISSEAVKHSATKIVPEQSILVVSRVGVGKIAVNSIPICTSQDFHSIVNSKNAFNPYFLANLLTIEIQQFLQMNQGSFIKGFLKNDLENLVLKFPSLEEQGAIAQILTLADRDIEILEAKKVLIEQQRNFLLNNLITGRIRLPEFIH